MELEQPARPETVDVREHRQRVYEIEPLLLERQRGVGAVRDKGDRRTEVLTTPGDAGRIDVAAPYFAVADETTQVTCRPAGPAAEVQNPFTVPRPVSRKRPLDRPERVLAALEVSLDVAPRVRCQGQTCREGDGGNGFVVGIHVAPRSPAGSPARRLAQRSGAQGLVAAAEQRDRYSRNSPAPSRRSISSAITSGVRPSESTR